MTVRKDKSTEESREFWRKVKELGEEAQEWYKKKLERNLNKDDAE